MDIFDVNVGKRTVGSKAAIRRLKDEGFIPGVLYNDDEGIPISLEEHQIKEIIDKHGKDVFLNINFNGKPIKVKIQEVQRDPIIKDIKHIDLIPVNSNVLH